MNGDHWTTVEQHRGCRLSGPFFRHDLDLGTESWLSLLKNFVNNLIGVNAPFLVFLDFWVAFHII